MMRLLSRYIFGQLFFTILSAIVLLSTVLWLAQSLKYIDFIANKGVPIILFCEMIFYLMPNLVVIVTPIAVLIGILFIYNKLINDHELVVMQASGLGYWQLAKPAILVSLIFTVVIYSFTSYLLPLSFRKYRDLSLSLRERSLVSLIQVGQFNTFGKYTIYARSQDTQGNYSGVLLYEGKEDNKFTLVMAEKGVLFDKNSGGKLQLLNGSRQEIDTNTGKPSILYFDRYIIETGDNYGEDEKEVRFLKAYERSIEDLLNPKENLTPKVRFEFITAAHQRILSPLYAMVFGLLGVCFMILGHYSRRGQALRIITACLVAGVIEITAISLIHALKVSVLMLYLSYGLVTGALLICFLLLTLWTNRGAHFSFLGRNR